jgi:tRNA isopentenyl-2-thiomethyl-A-37 hydroxylase MiaE
MSVESLHDTLQDTLARSLSKERHLSSAEVERILERRLINPSQPGSDLLPFETLWSLGDLEVGNVSCLQEASPLIQERVAYDLAYARFTEAYAIEKAGMSFAAKMSLLAPTLNEQKLYSLFAAEEARHFDFIDRSLGHPENLAMNPFVDLLHNLILTGERSCLLLLVQVVLEGWGIEHYAKMANTCQHPGARKALNGILADEAAHHGSGLSLFNSQHLSTTDLDYLEDKLGQFLYLVAVGPVSILQVLNKHLGPFTPEQHQQVLAEINATKETQRKLNLLKNLLRKAEAHAIVERLESRNAFTPLGS